MHQPSNHWISEVKILRPGKLSVILRIRGLYCEVSFGRREAPVSRGSSMPAFCRQAKVYKQSLRLVRPKIPG